MTPIIVSQYKSGDHVIRLETNKESYSVIADGAEVLKTPDLKRAIARFYHIISSIVAAQSEDKDYALNLLGDKVVMINREVLPKLALLGKSQDVEFIKHFDYSKLSFPFDEETFFKTIPSGAQNGMPLPESYDSAGEGGRKPLGVLQLKRTGKKIVDAIELKAQTMGMTPKLENDSTYPPSRDNVNKPIKIKATYQTAYSPPEQEPIIQKTKEADKMSEGDIAFETVGQRVTSVANRTGDKQEPIVVKGLLHEK